MFEAWKIVKVLKKLTDNKTEDISLRLIREIEVDVKKKIYKVEEAAIMILSISISSGEIDRNILTKTGKELVDSSEPFMKIFYGSYMSKYNQKN